MIYSTCIYSFRIFLKISWNFSFSFIISFIHFCSSGFIKKNMRHCYITFESSLTSNEYQLTLPDKMLKWLQNLLTREGKEMGSVLYTYRSYVKALPQVDLIFPNIGKKYFFSFVLSFDAPVLLIWLLLMLQSTESYGIRHK